MSLFIPKKRVPSGGQAVNGQQMKGDELSQTARKLSNPIIKPIEKPGRVLAPSLRERIASASTEPMDPKSENWDKPVDVKAAKQQEIKTPMSRLDALKETHSRRLYGLPKPANAFSSGPQPDITDISELFDTLKIEDVPKDTKEFTIKGLVPTLMEHQVAGVKFLRKREKDTVSGGFLCDDMGLGKTVQSIALILKNKPEKEATVKTTLVVAPLAVMFQWVDEIESKAPGLSVIAHQGPKRTTDVAKLQKHNVVVTTYDTLVSEFSDPEEKNEKKKGTEPGVLFQNTWFRVIADEAHHFRNPKTKVSKAMSSIKSEGRRWALTGTPLHNSVDDLYALFRYVQVKPYDKEPTWKTTIATPIKKNNYDREKAVKILKQLLAKLMLRREQKVIKLPTCHRHRKLLEFNPTELKASEKLSTYVESMYEHKQVSKLTLVLRMRQLCNDHTLIPGLTSEDSSDSDSDGENEAKKVKEEVDDLAAMLEEVAISRPVSTGSSKVKGIVDMIKAEPTRKTVMFSSFVQMLDGTAQALREAGIKCRVYQGQLSAEKRRTMLAEFNQDKEIVVLLCSLTCAAVGLNITIASKVVMVDPWWNPMIADQAVNRVHRIGQTREVDVYEMAIKDSVEERIYQLQDRKRELAVNMLEKQEALSPDELYYLLYGTRRPQSS